MEHVVVGVAVRWILRAVRETSRAQRSLIAGDPATGPRRSRAIIAEPLTERSRQHQRSPEDVERGWCEMGAWARLGVATRMIHALGRSPEVVCRGARVRGVLRRQRDLNSHSRHLRRVYIHRFRGRWHELRERGRISAACASAGVGMARAERR